jgi:hypothetical protein
MTSSQQSYLQKEVIYGSPPDTSKRAYLLDLNGTD